jgi:hypothetical protein
MLRRVDTARLVHKPNIFGKGPFALVVGRRSVLAGGRRKWTKAQVQKYLEHSSMWPCHVADLDGRRYWIYAGRTFSDNDMLNQEQVGALLVARGQRDRRKVDRAVAMVHKGQSLRDPARGAISDDVKQYVWSRSMQKLPGKRGTPVRPHHSSRHGREF